MQNISIAPRANIASRVAKTDGQTATLGR